MGRKAAAGFPEHSLTCEHADARHSPASAALPMFLDHRPLGMIVLDFIEPHHFTLEERRFLTILSSQCAVAMVRAETT